MLVVASAGSALAEDGLSAQDVKRVVGENTREVRQCYERHALKQDDATGKVALDLTVLPSGAVDPATVKVDAEGVKGDKFARCVQRKVARWQFPESDTGADVSYPFLFQHTRAR